MTRYKGKTGHEAIQDSILFGADRYTYKAEKLCDKIDVFLGTDPKISQQKRSTRRAGRAVLQKMSGWDVPLPPAAEYGVGLQGLVRHKYIERRKSKKGFKITKKGKMKIKQMEQKWFTK